MHNRAEDRPALLTTFPTANFCTKTPSKSIDNKKLNSLYRKSRKRTFVCSNDTSFHAANPNPGPPCVHACGTAGGDWHHRSADRHFIAVTDQGSRIRQADSVLQQSEATDAGDADVLPGEQELFPRQRCQRDQLDVCVSGNVGYRLDRL